jgi:hypothetical protein
LTSDPWRAANAVDELLRYDSSVQVTSRTTLEDVDDIGGIALWQCPSFRGRESVPGLKKCLILLK